MTDTASQEKLSIDRVIENFEQASAPPTLLMELLNAMEKPNVQAEELAEIIRKDQRLSAILLKLCNSAMYGLSKKIETIRDAVAVLGFKTIKSLIYSMLSHTTLSKEVKGYGLVNGALWQNALYGALYARHLAKIHDWADPEIAFTAALLRDMGKLALNDYVGNQRADLESLAKKDRVSYDKAEESILGLDHAEVGHAIAKKWALPESLSLAIRYHHSPSQAAQALPNSPHLKLVALIHLADIFAILNGHGVGADGLMYTLDEQALKILGVDITPGWMERTLFELTSIQQEASAFKQAMAS